MASLNVQPYLSFDGRCEDALEFYRRTLGAEVLALVRFKDSPDPQMRMPGKDDKIMHAMFRVGESTIMASDGQCLGAPTFQGFSLSITTPNEAENQRLFAALSEGGQVQMPLMKTFFSPSFGMLADRFGISWMLFVQPEGHGSARAEALASQLEAKVRDAEATLARLSDADWKKVTTAEKWSVAVTAHHYARSLEAVSGLITGVASGQPMEPFSMASLDAMNAQHARDFANCTKQETVELLRRGVAVAARTLRGLSDEQLARKGHVIIEAPPMTTEELAQAALLRHCDEHFGSIRQTVGH